MKRRRFLQTLFGGAATITTVSITGNSYIASAADANRAPYGSGPLGDWSGLSKSISTDAFFQAVKDNNGVMIIGDSITRANAYELATRVSTNNGLPLAVNAWAGRPTAPAVDWLESYAQYIPDRGIVIACGSNDIFRPLQYWQQVNRVMALADGKPVHWVSVYVDRWSGNAARRVADVRNSGLVNEQIRSATKTYSNLKIVEWYAALAGGHNESRIDEWLSDGVHTTATGATEWCKMIEASLGL